MKCLQQMLAIGTVVVMALDPVSAMVRDRNGLSGWGQTQTLSRSQTPKSDLLGSQALAVPLDWMQHAWGRGSAFFLRQNARTLLINTGTIALIAFVAWKAPWYAHVSDVLLNQHPSFFFLLMLPVSFFAALIGGLLEQALHIHVLERGKNGNYEWPTIKSLIFMGIFYSAFVEGFIYGWGMHALGSWIPIFQSANAQTLLDIFFVSPLIVDTMAVYIWERWVANHTHAQGVQTIKTRMKIFYPVLAIVWLPFSIAIMHSQEPVTRFMLTSSGVIAWNIAFVALMRWAHHAEAAFAFSPGHTKMTSFLSTLMKPYQTIFDAKGYGATVVGMIGIFFSLAATLQMYLVNPFDLPNLGAALWVAGLSLFIIWIHLNGPRNLPALGWRIARGLAGVAILIIVLADPQAGTGLFVLVAFLIAKGPKRVIRRFQAMISRAIRNPILQWLPRKLRKAA